MNEEFNLAEILKGCEGIELYSAVHGVCTVDSIDINNRFPICVIDKSDDICAYTKKGFYFDIEDGECLIFPSKEQRDWSKFVKPCMFKDQELVWCKLFQSGKEWYLKRHTGEASRCYENQDGTGRTYEYFDIRKFEDNPLKK